MINLQTIALLCQLAFTHGFADDNEIQQIECQTFYIKCVGKLAVDTNKERERKGLLMMADYTGVLKKCVLLREIKLKKMRGSLKK